MERPSDDDREEKPEGEARPTDLLSVALLVFFVSLIGVVGALLLLPILV